MVGFRLALTPAQRRGRQAEAQAERHLRQAGLQVLDRNARFRFGELDIVALDGATLVVVEVRARSASRFGSAVDTIGPRKQQRILRAASAWLARHPTHQHRAIRFDVITLQDSGTPQWLRGAFGQDGWS